MIRLLAAGTRIALIVVSMAVAIPAITFAQTNESATESVPAGVEAAEVNTSPMGDENGTGDDTSVETDPRARSEIASEIEVERQSRFNDLRREVLDDRAKLVDWWLAATAIFLTLLGIVAVIAGYLSFKRFREIEAEARQNVTASQQYTEEARHLVEEIKAKRHEAESLMEGLNAQIASDDPGKATQAILSVRQNPEASLTDKAISDAVSLQQQGKRDAAIEKWRAIAHVVEGSDNDLAARAWFSVGYLAMDEDPKGSVLANDRAIRLKPDYARAYNNRGAAKHELGRHEDAMADYNEAIRLKPDYAEAYRNRSAAKGSLGRHEDAMADCAEAIRLKPDDAVAYNNRGVAKRNLEQYEDAIADCTEAIRLKPDYARAYNNRGAAKGSLGQHEDAMADYDEAIRLKPDYAEAYGNRGAVKGSLGQHEDAIADCAEAIRLKPGYAVAYNNRGAAKAALDLKDEARKDFEIALELAQKANDAKIVAQAEQLLRDLDAAEDS